MFISIIVYILFSYFHLYPHFLFFFVPFLMYIEIMNENYVSIKNKLYQNVDKDSNDYLSIINDFEIKKYKCRGIFSTDYSGKENRSNNDDNYGNNDTEDLAINSDNDTIHNENNYYNNDRKRLIDREVEVLLSAEKVDTLIYKYPYSEQYDYNNVDYTINFNDNDHNIDGNNGNDYNDSNTNDKDRINDINNFSFIERNNNFDNQNLDFENQNMFNHVNKKNTNNIFKPDFDPDMSDLVRLQLGCSFISCVKMVNFHFENT